MIGEFFTGLFALIVLAFIAFLIFCGVTWGIREYQFSKVPCIEQECILLSHNFNPSTLRTHVAPIISGKGNVSCAVYSTGHAEQKVTVWDCGPYGRLTTEDKTVYRFAKERSTLYIRSSSWDTRIAGIKP